MFFTLPVKAYIEKECVKNHCDIFASIGKKALIVTGKSSSRKNGSLSDVVDVLNEAHIDYIIFDEVEENPSVETVMRARDKGICENVDFVIGVGGGSPLDASKAIASMIYHADKGEEYLYDKNADNKALPVICIPTTCGTGSEVTGISVITRHDLKTKVSMAHKVFPNIALCDGKYLISAPKRIIANTAVDALGHMIESYINASASPFSRMCADTGMKLWKNCKDILIGSSPLSAETANDLLTASTLGGMAIAQTGTSLPHGLSYTLTYEGGIPHGAAVGLFQSGYLRNADSTDRQHVLSLTGFADTDEIAKFIADISPVNVSQELLEKAAVNLLNNPKKLASCPYRTDADVLRDITGGIICSG